MCGVLLFFFVPHNLTNPDICVIVMGFLTKMINTKECNGSIALCPQENHFRNC